MSSDPSDTRRAMVGLAVILIAAAAVVTIGISLQRRARDPVATLPPATALSAPPRVTPAIETTRAIAATTTIGTTTTTSIPSTAVSPAAPPPTLAVTAGTVTGNGIVPGGVSTGARSATVGVAAADRRPLRVMEVSLVADPADHVGPCPTIFRFHGTIRVEGEGDVSYRFGRSDRSRGPVTTMPVSSSLVRVETSWSLGRRPERPFEGWQRLEVLTPQSVTSERATFRMTCVP